MRLLLAAAQVAAYIALDREGWPRPLGALLRRNDDRSNLEER